jgi:hypothetical protein
MASWESRSACAAMDARRPLRPQKRNSRLAGGNGLSGRCYGSCPGAKAGTPQKIAGTSSHVFAARECRSFSFGADWRAGPERAILAGMAYEYRVTAAADGTFPVELWSSRGGREQLVYKTPGFQTRQLAEAWIVPVEVQSGEAPQLQPRARVTYLKPRRSRVVIVSKPNPLPPPASPPALPES